MSRGRPRRLGSDILLHNLRREKLTKWDWQISPKGLLIAFEGVDGSGKTTHADLLAEWLREQGLAVTVCHWFSTTLVRELDWRLALKGLATAFTSSIMVATEFACRLQCEILPTLDSGGIVIADRYVYSAYVHDRARGIEPEVIFDLYRQAAKPDMVVYLLSSPTLAAQRKGAGGAELHFFEAGMDIDLRTTLPEALHAFATGEISAAKVRDSFARLQAGYLEEYASMPWDSDVLQLDATPPVQEIQDRIRAAARAKLRV